MTLSECEYGVPYWCWCKDEKQLVVAARGHSRIVAGWDMIDSTCPHSNHHRHGDENMIPLEPVIAPASVLDATSTLRLEAEQ